MRLRVVPVISVSFLRVWIYQSPLWISEKKCSRRDIPADGPGAPCRKPSRQAAW